MDQLGEDIPIPPFYDRDDFAFWKVRMKYFLMTNLVHWSCVQVGFTHPVNKDGETLEKKKWTKEQIHQSTINAEVTKTLEFSLPNDILCKVGGYNNAKELWNNLAKFHEGNSTSSHEEESSEPSSSHHGGEELEVEGYSTFKEEEKRVLLQEWSKRKKLLPPEGMKKKVFIHPQP